MKKLDFESLLEATGAQASAAGYEVKEIPVGEIGRYDDNRELTDADISDLYAQLVEDNFDLIHPVVIYPDPRNDREYTLICGERRHMCFVKAGRPSIVAIIRRDLTPQQIREKNLIENDQRLDEPLNSRGKRYKKYIEEFGVTQAEAARKFAKPASFISDLVNYYAFIDDFPLVRDLYQSGNGLTDRHVLKNLLVISKKSETGAKSIIAFGEANRCLNRAFTEAALNFDLHGDTEVDCRNWLMGFKEEKAQAAVVKAEKKAEKKAAKDNKKVATKEKDEEQLEFDNLGSSDDYDVDSDSDTQPDIAVAEGDAAPSDVLPDAEAEGYPVASASSDEPAGTKKHKYRTRPLTEAEVAVKYQGSNYYLDLRFIADDDGKILIRNISGDFFEVEPAAVTLCYVI